MKTSHKSDELKNIKKKGGGGVHKSGTYARAKISGRCYYLLTIPCKLSRMQGFTCLIKSYKTNMFRLFP
jgi:hypothetical protein